MGKQVYVGIDVGGSNITVSLANIDTLHIEKTFQFETKSYVSLAEPLEPVMKYIKLINATVKACCVGAAGPLLSQDVINLTNAHFVVSKKELRETLLTTQVTLVNDFMLLGYALLSEKSVFKELTPHKDPREGAKVIIGAGTGLGKCLVTHSIENDCSVVIPSEGGNCDYNAKSDLDREIITFIMKETGHNTVSYEDILSGNGMRLLHEFFEGNRVEQEQIFLSSSKTLKYFAHVLGQFAKNSALNTVSIGGVYFAGGILINHPEIFEQEEFKKSFIASNRHLDLLSLIPLFLLEDYTTSAFGACYAASLLVKKNE